MNQEKYNLNWATYSDHLKEMLHDMMTSEELSDVTLICDDKIQFKAHKIVLSSCSSVFKNIIKNLPEKNSGIYLRGIQHQEMESILEFMYLGVATFHQEQMTEFLNVAKSLEIKEISNDVEFGDQNINFNDIPETREGIIQDIISEDVEFDHENINVDDILESGEDRIKDVIDVPQNEQVIKSEDKANTTDNNKIFKHASFMLNTDGKFQCNQCESSYTSKRHLRRHIKTVHEGIKYDCSQCSQQFTQGSSLKIHIQSFHKGVKFACSECDHQSSTRQNLTLHIQSIHEGVKYSCDQCALQFSHLRSLSTHMKHKH